MPAIRTKALATTVSTAGPEDPAGTFTALVSVFGNEDYAGDIVEPGAFAESIKKFASGDVVMPVVWSHDFGKIQSFVGYFSAIEETDEGLLVKGHLDLSIPEGARLYDLMKQRIIVEFSWSGEVLEYEVIEPDDPEDEWAWWFAGIRILSVDLWEAGPCFKGMNPETQLISIKAADFAGPLAKRMRRHGKALSDDELAHLQALTAGRAPLEPALEPEKAAAVDAPNEDAPELPADTVQRSSAATPNVRALLELSTTK